MTPNSCNASAIGSVSFVDDTVRLLYVELFDGSLMKPLAYRTEPAGDALVPPILITVIASNYLVPPQDSLPVLIRHYMIPRCLIPALRAISLTVILTQLHTAIAAVLRPRPTEVTILHG